MTRLSLIALAPGSPLRRYELAPGWYPHHTDALLARLAARYSRLYGTFAGLYQGGRPVACWGFGERLPVADLADLFLAYHVSRALWGMPIADVLERYVLTVDPVLGPVTDPRWRVGSLVWGHRVTDLYWWPEYWDWAIELDGEPGAWPQRDLWGIVGLPQT